MFIGEKEIKMEKENPYAKALKQLVICPSLKGIVPFPWCGEVSGPTRNIHHSWSLEKTVANNKVYKNLL